MEIKVLKDVLDNNCEKAAEVRNTLKKKSIIMLNLISSPGSGKTSLLEQTLASLNGKYKTAIIEGDVSTNRDAQRLAKYNVPVVMINTEGGCHLDSNSIAKALKELNLDELDLIFAE